MSAIDIAFDLRGFWQGVGGENLVHVIIVSEVELVFVVDCQVLGDLVLRIGAIGFLAVQRLDNGIVACFLKYPASLAIHSGRKSTVFWLWEIATGVASTAAAGAASTSTATALNTHPWLEGALNMISC